jgi:glycosyltransferase involved in cell wall biosynthesis
MRVTIGIPLFNCEQWISSTIESALNQTWQDKEVIVIDDGSTDRSAEICHQFGDRIRYFRQKNQGVCSARNRILKESTGEWIQYLDHDDYLFPEKIEASLNSLSDPEKTHVIFSEQFNDEYRENKLINRIHYKITSTEHLLEDWLRISPPQTNTGIWKKKTIEILGDWNESMVPVEDVELTLRLLQANLPIHQIKRPLAIRRLCCGSLSRRQQAKVCTLYGKLINDCESWFEAKGRWDDNLKEIARKSRFWLARELAMADIDEAIQYYRREKRAGRMGINPTRARLAYKIPLKLFGFAFTERSAKWLRQFRNLSH